MKISDILYILRRLEGILEGIAAFKGAVIVDDVSSTLLDCCEVLDNLCDKIEEQGCDLGKLIDVDEARAYAREHWPSPVVRKPIEELLDRCPAVEDEHKEPGRWVLIEGFWACSECGASPADWEAKSDNPLGLPPFCHSCGAKMG